MRREKTQIRKIRKGDNNKHHGNPENIWDCLYFNKFENLEEMEKFLDTYDHPKLNYGDINYVNRSITQNEI
jgi:hypothetical protein